MCVLSLEDGMAAESWYAWLAFRSRVSMSAIGSVIVMGVVPLSPRFLMRWVSGTWRRACRRSGAGGGGGWGCVFWGGGRGGGAPRRLAAPGGGAPPGPGGGGGGTGVH